MPKNKNKKSVAKKTYKKSTKKFNFKNPLLIVVVLLVIAVGVFLIFRSFAASVVGSIQGEALTIEQGVTGVTKVSGSLTGDPQSMKFTSNAVASGTVNLSGVSNQIVVRAKGDQCNGAPNMAVSVDGKQLVNANVSGSSWGDYTVNLLSALTQGSHSVSVQMTNPYTGYKGKGRNIACIRALYVDVIQFTDTTSPPASTDTTKPTTSISQPTNGATLNGTLQVNAAASDNVGVTKVELYIDGNPFGSALTATPYNWSWDTTQTTNASHTLYTKAYDAAGNVGTSATVSVTVNNTTTALNNCDNKALPAGVPALTTSFFCDDFIGSSVDTAKWAFKSYAEADNGQGNKGNQQLEWNQPQNCSVSGGLLTITAKPDSINSPSGIHYDWSSCLITSTPSVALQYGYIEERAKLPKQAGFWPGFWTWQVPGVNQWVETDAYEYYSNNPTSLYLTQHSGAGGQCVVNPGFDPSSDFHTYASAILSTGTKWYVDGKEVCSTPATAGNKANIISNLFVYSQKPPAPGTVETKQVDYIKVWQ